MIVAGIETAWSGRACPNRHGLLQTDYRSHAPPIQIARGGEMGRFYLGSTVILLFGPGAVALDGNLQPGESIRQGESLGVLCRAPQD
jgi:phosphatidylserine decarboxylase